MRSGMRLSRFLSRIPVLWIRKHPSVRGGGGEVSRSADLIGVRRPHNLRAVDGAAL